MSDNIKQESTESLQTKEQEQQAGSNKRTLEAENDKAAKKAFKEKKKKEQKGSLKNIKLLEGEFSNIINLMKKIKIEQLYSNIYFGNANPYLNIYTTTIVNGIYGNIANIFDIGKLYLNIIPNFTENKIKGSVRLHIKFRIIMIFKSIPIIIRIMLRKHRTKEGD